VDRPHEVHEPEHHAEAELESGTEELVRSPEEEKQRAERDQPVDPPATPRDASGTERDRHHGRAEHGEPHVDQHEIAERRADHDQTVMTPRPPSDREQQRDGADDDAEVQPGYRQEVRQPEAAERIVDRRPGRVAPAEDERRQQRVAVAGDGRRQVGQEPPGGAAAERLLPSPDRVHHAGVGTTPHDEKLAALDEENALASPEVGRHAIAGVPRSAVRTQEADGLHPIAGAEGRDGLRDAHEDRAASGAGGRVTAGCRVTLGRRLVQMECEVRARAPVVVGAHGARDPRAHLRRTGGRSADAHQRRRADLGKLGAGGLGAGDIDDSAGERRRTPDREPRGAEAEARDGDQCQGRPSPSTETPAGHGRDGREHDPRPDRPRRFEVGLEPTGRQPRGEAERDDRDRGGRRRRRHGGSL
jgi:hypothetical protein